MEIMATGRNDSAQSTENINKYNFQEGFLQIVLDYNEPRHMNLSLRFPELLFIHY